MRRRRRREKKIPKISWSRSHSMGSIHSIDGQIICIFINSFGTLTCYYLSLCVAFFFTISFLKLFVTYRSEVILPLPLLSLNFLHTFQNTKSQYNTRKLNYKIIFHLFVYNIFYSFNVMFRWRKKWKEPSLHVVTKSKIANNNIAVKILLVFFLFFPYVIASHSIY